VEVDIDVIVVVDGNVVVDLNVDGVATLDVGVVGDGQPENVTYVAGLNRHLCTWSVPSAAQPHADVKVNVKGGDPLHVQVKDHEHVNADVKVNVDV
jgi:hypothetical protein